MPPDSSISAQATVTVNPIINSMDLTRLNSPYIQFINIDYYINNTDSTKRLASAFFEIGLYVEKTQRYNRTYTIETKEGYRNFTIESVRNSNNGANFTVKWTDNNIIVPFAISLNGFSTVMQRTY